MSKINMFLRNLSSGTRKNNVNKAQISNIVKAVEAYYLYYQKLKNITLCLPATFC